MRALVVIIGVVAALSACRGPRPNMLREDAKVTVVEFSVADNAKVTSYDASYDNFGMECAESIADWLRHRRRTAEAVPRSASPTGDLVVTGTITHLHGGSPAKRILIGYGAGHSEFGVQGVVRRSDGTRVAAFSEERAGGGWSNTAAVRNAQLRACRMVARMIYLGEYRGGRPGSHGYLAEPTAPTPTGKGPVSARLRELDQLRDQGMVSDAEYQERRRTILEDL